MQIGYARDTFVYTDTQGAKAAESEIEALKTELASLREKYKAIPQPAHEPAAAKPADGISKRYVSCRVWSAG
jgi:plasmid stabilization system protein ParE